jgi:hypothetical protein
MRIATATPAAEGEFLSSGQQRCDGFVAAHEQGSDGPQTGRNGFKAMSRADPLADQSNATFRQIVPSAQIVGLMFWFSRNRLVGSYLFLSATSRP